MPYYRITILLKDKTGTQGIKYYDNHSIDAVTHIIRLKAGQHYGVSNVIDVEAAMLSNHCTAVRYYQESQQQVKNTPLNKFSAAPGKVFIQDLL